MRVIRRYTTIVLFVAAFLLGVQIPGFIAQYNHRISAHYAEAELHIRGFQEIADRYLDGDLEALIEKHKRSSDPVFRAEARLIENAYFRIQRFSRELAALDANLFSQVLHVVLHADPDVLEESISGYAAAAPLEVDTALCGLGLGILTAAGFNLLFSLTGLLLGSGRRRHPHNRSRST